MLGRFHKVFGITDDLATERRRFVERINQTAYGPIEDNQYSYRSVFERVCYWLGTNSKDRIREANKHLYASTRITPKLRSLTKDNFTQTLKVAEFLYKALESAPKEQASLANHIETALSHATIDIEVRWQDGMFYPSGAKELDERLIEEPLQWLNAFPGEKADYLKALTAYNAKRFGDVIGDCYLVVEGVARSVLGNSKTLDNNREDLLRMIGLSQEWKALLSNFITYANEFKRHASDKRHVVNPIEIEGFLYMTGLLVRMIVEATKRPA